jgi:hypothetical protein
MPFIQESAVSVETDPGFWKQVSSWLWVVVMPLLALVWGLLTRRIDSIGKKADEALPKKDFDAYSERQRQDIKELYGLNAALKDHVNSRVETLRTDMHEAIGRLGDKMQKGFDDIRKELTEVLRAVSRRKE